MNNRDKHSYMYITTFKPDKHSFIILKLINIQSHTITLLVNFMIYTVKTDELLVVLDL